MNVQLPVHSAHRSLSETSNVSESIVKRKDAPCFTILYEYCVHYMHPFVRIRLNALHCMHARALVIAWLDFDK